jgi:hypothetical protein
MEPQVKKTIHCHRRQQSWAQDDVVMTSSDAHKQTWYSFHHGTKCPVTRYLLSTKDKKIYLAILSTYVLAGASNLLAHDYVTNIQF